MCGEVLSMITVHVDGRIGDVHPDQFLDDTFDPSLFENLSNRCPRRMLAGIDYAGDGRPGAIVGTPNQQDGAVIKDDGRHAWQPQKVVADPLAEVKDEVWNGHTATVVARLHGARQRARLHPRQRPIIGCLFKWSGRALLAAECSGFVAARRGVRVRFVSRFST